MSIAQKILEKITDNLSVIAGGAAVAAVAAGAGYAAFATECLLHWCGY